MFHRQIDFKQEKPIGNIPEDWEAVRLGDLGVLQYGITTSAVKEQTETKFLRITDIKNGGNVDWQNAPYCRPNSEEMEKFRLITGDVVFARIGATTGKACYIDEAVKSVFGSYLIRFQLAAKKGTEPKFLYYLTQSQIYWSQVNRVKEGRLKKGLNTQLLANLKFPQPPLAEQRAIVGVLGVVDLAVAKTGEVIAKTERLKKGLMQELLTRGIGHKEYRPTPIGEIPKEWDVVTLGDICDQRNEMFQPSANNNYRFVGLEHIASGETRIHTHAQDVAVKSSKFKFYPEDILYGKLRPYLDKSVLVDIKGICSTDLLVLKPKERVLNEFLIYVLHSTEFLKHAVATTSGTNHPRTSWTAISKFKFGLPKHSEQQKIAETLSAVDKKIELEKKEKAKLERVKLGLMNLLLTGKVRVKGD